MRPPPKRLPKICQMVLCALSFQWEELSEPPLIFSHNLQSYHNIIRLFPRPLRGPSIESKQSN